MSPSFVTLPAEILSNIVKTMRSDGTICNLARCSHQLYLCTMPHMYRDISVLEKTEEENGQLIRLASLLIRRPDLATHVRHFSLGGYKQLELPGSSNLVAGELVWFSQAFAAIPNASSLSDDEKRLCLDQFSPSSGCPYDLILARLLPELVKVETVELDWRCIYDTFHIERMLRRAARREKPFDDKPPFRALKSLTFSHCTTDSPRVLRSVSVIASVVKLPAIRTISGGFKGTGETGTAKAMMELKSASFPLNTFDLSAAKLSAADLSHLLRAPRALKHFILSICPPIAISLLDIRKALDPQRRCLETLELDDIISDIPLYGPMPSYVRFTALRSLTAAALLFLTANLDIETHMLPQILPPYLETLHLLRLHASFKSLLEALEHLITHKSPRQTVSLECLILDEEFAEDPREDDEVEGPKLMEVLWKNTQETAINRLCKVAATQGVVIHVIEDPYDGME